MEIAFTHLSRNCGTKSNQLIRRRGKNIAIRGIRSMTGREFSCFLEELPCSISSPSLLSSPLFEGLFFTARVEATIIRLFSSFFV